MIELEAVRAAVLSDLPWSRLDELVRAELAAGRRTRQIYEELAALADGVDDTPGLTDGGSDAFGDTLDKLTGNCHESQWYEDPPNTTLPTKDEIAKLPRWARVAFAARCARRVLPLPTFGRPDTSPHTVWATQQAVRYIELSAGKTGALAQPSQLFALIGDIDGKGFGPLVDAIVVLAKADARDDLSLTGYASNAASSASGDAFPIADIRLHLRRDFDHLAELAHWQKWTDDTPVPPEVFGPLWPEGPPQGWPADPDAPKHGDLPVDFFAREKASAKVVEDDIVRLFDAINAYHIARGGGPLTIEHFRPLLAALVPVEA